MKLLDIYQKCQKLPFGNALFSKLVCFKAPYFSTIKPLITELDQNICLVHLKKRRKVTNHLGTVHAIAMCNMSELAAGLMTDASIPSNMRWIPKGMTVQYLKKAKSHLTATTKGDEINWQKSGDVVVHVDVFDEAKDIVFSADITMNLKEKA